MLKDVDLGNWFKLFGLIPHTNGVVMSLRESPKKAWKNVEEAINSALLRTLGVSSSGLIILSMQHWSTSALVRSGSDSTASLDTGIDDSDAKR